MSIGLRLRAKALALMVMLMFAATLAYSLEGPWRKLYLPGPTTSGHFQIEAACNECHSSSFSDRETLQAACVRCHAEELTVAHDSHPEKKFTDPRNADRVKVLDARYCITCHREHRPEATSAMGLTLPGDYCFRCHEHVRDERPSHATLGFDTCASAGCHNFHDNRGLYEDFLLKHLVEPELLPRAQNPERPLLSRGKKLERSAADAPKGAKLATEQIDAWAASAHAAGGVNCSGCHAAAGSWNDEVADRICADCHEAEQRGFERSRHGMRIAAKLEPMRVAEARAVMKPDAADHTLGCTSCHGAHRFDIRRASADACLGCHDDRHSLAFRGSPHERAWLSDPSGENGASCATCHLPRATNAAEGGPSRSRVEHNQNDNLRPSEKMLRSVCTNCHGLGFSIDALADPLLVQRNFTGRPAQHIQSLNMVEQRSRR
jgi:hypothetical protein